MCFIDWLCRFQNTTCGTLFEHGQWDLVQEEGQMNGNCQEVKSFHNMLLRILNHYITVRNVGRILIIDTFVVFLEIGMCQ